ncbi:MAG: glycoside hydrolase family 16 protein [Paludibacteraceae bacterium]|nr:glycoside hydrolase family 16 protein [Paludibacteraceae bacterium]
MNLYWKSLFGGLMSTSKYEDKLHKEVADYKRFLLISESKELEEYNELYKQVKSSNFKELKRTLRSRKYKDTQEYRDMAKFKKLDSNSKLKTYFQVLDSQELADYLAFKATPEFVSLANHDLVKKSPELTRFKKFEKSKDYQIYTRFHGSYIVKEYLELKEKVSNPEFQKNNEFWANPKRWETTKEYQDEKRFHQLADNEDIQFYVKHKIEDFKYIAGCELVFEDNFDWNSLNASKWDPGFHYKSPLLVGNHSFVNEQQANNNGNNVRVIAGNLHIVTKEQKTEALTWHPEKGFVQKEFNYTSDVIHGCNASFQKGGLYRAKMRFAGSKGVTHALWLRGEEKTPHINICKCENGEIEVGIYWSSKFETKYTSTRIKGLNLSNFFVYSFEWNEKELIWYINDLEVFRTSNFMPQEAMYPMINSFIAEGKKAGEADFEIDYIKVYKKK